MGASSVLDTDRVVPSSTGAQQDIKTFLRKPNAVGSYAWATSATTNTDLFSIDPAVVLMANTIWTRKIEGFRNFKGRVHFKVQVSATPFHAGSFALIWKPWPASHNDRDKMHNSLISKSQLPSVLYTCEDDSCEISFPFLGPVDYFDKIASVPWTWGTLIATVFSPLRTVSGSNSINLNVFMWFEDVTIAGLIPQSGVSVKVTRAPRRVIPSDEEVNGGSGPISRALGAGVSLSSSLAQIPMFAPLCKPATWVLDKAAQVSSVFGWSKPSAGDGGKLRVVYNSSDAFAPNQDGTDNCFNLSPCVNSKVTPSMMLTPRVEDENSIKFIARHWSYLTTFSLTTTNSSGDLLYSQLLRPDFFSSTYTVPATLLTNYTVHRMTPLCWLSKCFDSWRGPLDFKFVFVKTGYHAAQVAFAFNLDSSMPSYANTQYLHREIVDLQLGNEFCFTVPYARSEPFISTNDHMGSIGCYLVNNLQAPSTVSGTIEVLVYVRGGSGIHFLKPTTSIPIPVFDPQIFLPQGNVTEEEGAMCQSGSDNIGSSVNFEPDKNVAQFCIGNSIDSVLGLGKRFTKMTMDPGNPAFNPVTPVLGTVTPTYCITLDPHYFGYSTFLPAGAPYYYLEVSTSGADVLARLSGLYLFNRGSVKFKVKNRQANPSSQTFQTFLIPFYNVPYPSISRNLRSSVITLDSSYSDMSSDQGITAPGYIVPQWSDYYGYPRVDFQVTASEWFSGHSLVYVTSNSSFDVKDLDGVQFCRAAGEDFHFSFFLGIPTCVVNVLAA